MLSCQVLFENEKDSSAVVDSVCDNNDAVDDNHEDNVQCSPWHARMCLD